MNCRKAQEWLSAEMDGELAESRKARLEAHMASCHTCRKMREQWRGLRVQFDARDVPAGRTPEASWADVQRAIRLTGDQPRESGPGWAPGLRWATAAVTLVLAAFVGLRIVKRAPIPEVAVVPMDGGRVEWAETGLPGASPMVYEDIESGLVIIWVVEADHKELPHVGT